VRGARVNIEDDAAPCTPEVFTYSGQGLELLKWLPAISLPLIGSVMTVARRDRFLSETFGALVAMAILLLFFLTFGALVSLMRSDLVIDDQGITRILCGKTVQVIRWDNIKLIKAEPVNVPGLSARLFAIYRKVNPKFTLLRGTKVDDRIQGAPRLVELLDSYATKHSIEIKVRTWPNGKLVQVDHLVRRPRDSEAGSSGVPVISDPLIETPRERRGRLLAVGFPIIGALVIGIILTILVPGGTPQSFRSYVAPYAFSDVSLGRRSMGPKRNCPCTT
jgi:hypothetical protein